MTLEADIDRVQLELERPFTIARGTTNVADVAVVTLTDGEGNQGLGAGSPRRYYGETVDTAHAVLPELCQYVTADTDTSAPATLEHELSTIVNDNPAARTAVSVAYSDLHATRLGVPLYRAMGHHSTVDIESSYTLGIDDPAAMAAHATEAVDNGHGVLKVKLGSPSDENALRAVRDAAPDARIRVDANAAWTPAEAIQLIEVCEDVGVEFVEQPVPATDPSGLKHVYERSRLPIAADESCVTLPDVAAVADRCDIINIKLMKCGGVWEALRMIHTARAHNLEVMLGCMIESAISIAAAAHLAPLVDYADLDGSLLVASDPYTGSPVEPGAIELDSTAPGLGVSPV